MAPSHRAPRHATSGRHGFPWRAAGLALAALLAFTGSGIITAELAVQSLIAQSGPVLTPPQPAPAPPRPVAQPRPDRVDPAETAPTDAEPTDADPADADDAEVPDPAWTGMPPAEPVGIRIPRINVDAEVMPVGVDETGQVEVPPLEEALLAGWYDRGPTPGEVGNSVIVGHVDSYATGPAVFFSLGALRPGDLIEVARADDSVATFEVDEVVAYPKEELPNELIYGPSDRATLRLITCGGTFDRRTGAYPDNVVVFATLVDDDGLGPEA